MQSDSRRTNRRIIVPMAARFVIVLLVLQTLQGCDAPVPPVQPLPGNLSAAEAAVREAVQAAHQQASASPERAEDRITLALVLDANGFEPQASQTWTTARTMAPSDPRPDFFLAMQAADDSTLAEAIEAMDRSIAIDDTYAPSFWRSGLWALDLGQADNATARFNRAVQIDPAAAAALIGLARADLDRENIAGAISRLQRLAERSTHPHVRYLLGQALRRGGRNEEAAAFLQTGSPEAPNYPDPRGDQLLDAQRGLDAEYSRADRLLTSNDLAKAQRSIQAALQVFPQDIHLLSRLGEVHRRRNDVPAWLRVAKRATAIDATSFAALLNLSMALRANAQPGPALTAAMDAVAVNPDVPDGHLQVARLHLIQRRAPDAVTSLDRAFALGVTKPEERLQYAAVLLEVGRFEDAIAQGESVINAFPRTPPAWIILARAHRSAGRLPVAFEAAMAGLQHTPGHPQLTALAEELRAEGLAQQEAGR